MTTALALAGERAITEATRLWSLDIIDPKYSDRSDRATMSRHRISNILAEAGWAWEVPYKGDGQVEWCGLFAAACWRKAGLDPRWLATYWASTYRLGQWARYRSFDDRHPNPRPTSGELRLVATLNEGSTSLPWTPQAGDVLTIGDGHPPNGDHICLVESFDPATLTFATIEGNGTGLGPDGMRRQGVVRGSRHIGGGGYCARLLIRPSFDDLIAEAPI